MIDINRLMDEIEDLSKMYETLFIELNINLEAYNANMRMVEKMKYDGMDAKEVIKTANETLTQVKEISIILGVKLEETKEHFIYDNTDLCFTRLKVDAHI